jgi:hypothetical protein
MTRWRPALAVLALVSLPMLAACTSSSPAEEPDLSSIFSSSEVEEARAGCLTDRGWDVTFADGTIQADIPQEQLNAYNEDSLECLEEAGIDPNAPLTAEQYTAIYGWYGQIQDCLEGAGYDTPEKPSQATFEETYDSEPWIPWIQIAPEDIPKAHEACPVMNAPTS